MGKKKRILKVQVRGTHAKTAVGPKPATVEFDCLGAKQGDSTIVVFKASAKQLWGLVTINEREPDKDKGYQRVLTPGRVTNIARYVDRGNIIPNSILISFKKATLSADKRTLSVPNTANAGWIIDGQHRLAGIHVAMRDLEVPVVAFIGLDPEKQIELFVKINKEAKNVPSSLYLDLLKHLPNKSEGDLSKERAVDLAHSLRRDEDSPFFGRIAILGSPRVGEISLTNFVRKVGPLVARNKGRFNTYSATTQIGIFKNYYKALSHVFPTTYEPSDATSIFFKTVGFGALINALPVVFDLCYTQHQGFKLESVIDVLQGVVDFDFVKWSELGTGTDAERIASEQFIAALQQRSLGQDGQDGLDIPL